MSAASTNEPLEVKVIYSAAGRPRRAGKVVSATHLRRGGATRRTVLGTTNLIVAGVLCYSAWWPVDGFIYNTFSWKTPVPGLDVEAAAQMFGILPEPASAESDSAANEGPHREGASDDAVPEEPAPGKLVTRAAPSDELPRMKVDLEAQSKFSGRTTRAIVATSAYSWLAFATMASGALALAGGAALGRGRDPLWPRIGLVLGVGLVLGLAWGVYDTLTEYGMQYPTARGRDGMVGIVLLCALIGFTIGRRTRGLMRIAAVTLILSAVNSVVALYLGGQCGAVEPEYTAGGFLALVFVVHSAYGWVLLPMATRVRL